MSTNLPCVEGKVRVLEEIGKMIDSTKRPLVI